MAIESTTAAQFAAVLAERLTGDVIVPDHADYDAARRVWNGMIDKRPAAIARCADADDVATAVRYAAAHELPLAVRGGGHNVAGTAVVDDGLVIDLSAMRGVRIDASGRTVHVQGGATGPTSIASPRRWASPRRAGSSPRPAWPAWRSAAASPTSAGATG